LLLLFLSPWTDDCVSLVNFQWPKMLLPGADVNATNEAGVPGDMK